MIKSIKLRKIAITLSTALMLSTGIMAVDGIAGNETTAIVAEATQAQSMKNEAELRQIVLGKYPGKIVKAKSKYKHGLLKCKYKILQDNGVMVEVEINGYGYITDVEYEGQVVNGVYYDWD